LPDHSPATINHGDWFYGRLSQPFVGHVDDVVIGYEFTAIDGEGDVLGSAGPIYATPPPHSRTISGSMRFDLADFPLFEPVDRYLILLHEMGHTLGLVGSLGRCGLCSAADGFAYSASCTRAHAEYDKLGLEVRLALEEAGGEGKECHHWSEHSFPDPVASEIMTGYFEEHLEQPLSRVTVAALADLGGYTVDYARADPYPLSTRRRLDGSNSTVLAPTTSFTLIGRIAHEDPIVLPST